MSFRTAVAAVLVTAAVPLGTLTAHAGTPGTIQVTGTKLGTALLPVSALGPGARGFGPPVTSGGQLTGYTLRIVAGQSCGKFWFFYDYFGFGETAWATMTTSSSGLVTSYDQTIFQFATAHKAGQFFSAEKAKFRSCRAFKVSGKQPIYVSLQRLSVTSVARHPAFLVTWSETFPGLPGSLTRYILVAADGADIFIAGGFDVNNTPPASPSLPSIISKLITRVSALH